MNLTEHDTAQGLCVPSEFLDLLPGPPSTEFYDLRKIVAELLEESGLTEPVKQTEEKKSHDQLSQA